MQEKKCTKCQKTKPYEKFNKELRNKKTGITSQCKQCHKEYIQERLKDNAYKEQIYEHNRKYYKIPKNNKRRREQLTAYRKNNPEKVILRNAKYRAKKYNLRFDLDLKDIIIPEKCPLLEIKLKKGEYNRDKSPSLDRIDNNKGYVKENVWIISNLANTIKSKATIKELQTLIRNLNVYTASQSPHPSQT